MAEQTVNAKRKSASVTSHPLFPGIVALWFAALFGLGSLAIRPTLLEEFVLAAHLDTIIPAAAPPLGVTARILLALVLAVAGGLAGAAIAKRITRPRLAARERKRGATVVGKVKLRARDAHPDAPARMPISAHDEIGGSRIESGEPFAGALPGRRRSLAIRDEGSNKPDYHDFAPLPGGMVEFSGTDMLDLDEVDLGAFAEIAPVDAEFTAAPAEAEVAGPRQIFGQTAVIDAVPLDVAAPVADFVRPEPNIQVTSPTASAAEQIVAAPLDSLGLVALTERFALSLQRRREAAQAAQAARSAEAAASELPPAPIAEPADAGPAPIARMASSDFAATAGAAPLAPMALPASLRPLDFDQPADDDEDYASFLPLRKMSMPVAPVVDDAVVGALGSDVPSGDEVDAADGYSSLLELNQPASLRQQFIRIEEPDVAEPAIEPVVIFPGQAARSAAPSQAESPIVPSEVTSLRRFDAPTGGAAGPIASAAPAEIAPDAEETERALRAALATLQRMSGAA